MTTNLKNDELPSLELNQVSKSYLSKKVLSVSSMAAAHGVWWIGATEPVTGCHTDKGRWYYGLIVGSLTVIIRSINPAYPEGVFLAILIMNMFAPLIDYYVVQSNIKMRLNRNV